MKSIWLTWEIQRRNKSLSRSLGAELYELSYEGHRLSRYINLTAKTLRILSDAKPDVVFAQNPSIVLAFLVVLYGKIKKSKCKVIIDCHNVGVYPGRLQGLARWIAKNADACIVTNGTLANAVDSWGGRALIMPDPLPELIQASPIELNSPSVLFICSWADDEPIEEVISAASMLLNKSIPAHFYITGKPKLDLYPSANNLPENTKLTGYLSEQDFDSYLECCDIVLDLTTRDECMVCGAYEGVAAGKPMLLSNNNATAQYFTKGVELTNNSAEDIATKLARILGDIEKYREEVALLKDVIVNKEALSVSLLREKLQL